MDIALELCRRVTFYLRRILLFELIVIVVILTLSSSLIRECGANWPPTADTATCRSDEFGPPNFDGPYVSKFGWDLQDESIPTMRVKPPEVQKTPTPCCEESQEVNHTGRFADYMLGHVGGYRIKESTFANEGRSFCIIGEHVANSSLRNSRQLRGFAKLFIPKVALPDEELDIGDGGLPSSIPLSLLKNYSSNGYFDIGSHINPDDLNQMNYVDLRASAQTNKPPLSPQFVEKTNRSFKDYEAAACRYTGKLLDRFDGHVYWSRPAVHQNQPHYSCVNPYEVVVSEIHAHGIRLHNYLHVTVIAKHIAAPDVVRNCPTGKGKWLILEARDQRGLPVGHFTDEVPCDSYAPEVHSGPGGIPGRNVYGSQDNILPCMYNPRDAVSHPGLFLVALPDEGDYFTAVHATWRFAQHTSDFISEIHFVALVVESAQPIRYFTSRKENFHAKSRCGWAWMCPYHNVKSSYSSDDCRHPQEPSFIDFKKLKWHWKPHTFAPGPYFRKNGTMLGWKSMKPKLIYNDLYDLYGFQKPRFSVEDEGWRKGIYLENEDWDKYSACALSDETNRRPYGFIARKRVLYPQISTLGGWDYASPFWVPDYVDCHQGLSDRFFKQSERKNLSNPSWMYRDRGAKEAPAKLNVPQNFDTYDVDANLGEERLAMDPSDATKKPVMVFMSETGIFRGEYDEKPVSPPYPPLPWQHVFRWFQKDKIKLTTLYSQDHDIKTYLGTRGTYKAYDEPLRGGSLTRAEEIGEEIAKFRFETMASMGQSERCPCPALPTLPPLEERTKPPLELEGRRLHAEQMLVAWMVLIPIALFSSRYFKETYSRVFFLQEFWWLTIHVLTLLTALVFIAGGIYVSRLNRQTEQVYSNSINYHIIIGWVAIGLFIVQVITGPFRALRPAFRAVQIGLHWLFGMLEYILGVTAMFFAGGIKQGFFNCQAFYLLIGFLCVQLIFHAVMDIGLRLSDRAMRLRPPRTYLPPPVMRLFHNNAPFAKFRMAMLAIYYLTCIGFYAGFHRIIHSDGGEESCYVPPANVSDVIET